jgi:hypothetical protein
MGFLNISLTLYGKYPYYCSVIASVAIFVLLPLRIVEALTTPNFSQLKIATLKSVYVFTNP